MNRILKGRFTILNNIDETPKSMKELVKVIDVCVILHNFLIEHNLNMDDQYFYTPREEAAVNEDVSALEADNELNLPVVPGAAQET